MTSTTTKVLLVVLAWSWSGRCEGEWWVATDVLNTEVLRVLANVPRLQIQGALDTYEQCHLNESKGLEDEVFDQRKEVILNQLLRNFHIHDRNKRPEFFPCANVLDAKLPDVPAWTMPDAELKARMSGYDLSDQRGKILFVVAVLSSSKERMGHVQENLVPHIPHLVIFNATEMNNTSQMTQDYFSLGLRLKGSLSAGEAAWWITQMRIYQMILASDYEFAVILQDDAIIQENFVSLVHRIVASLSPHEERVGYRLSLWDYGLLVPRKSIPRILAAVCNDPIAWPTDSFSFRHIGCCPLFFDAAPYNNLVDQVGMDSLISVHSDARHGAVWPDANELPPQLESGLFEGIEPLCSANYPGKIDYEQASVRFDPESDLRSQYNIDEHNSDVTEKVRLNAK